MTELCVLHEVSPLVTVLIKYLGKEFLTLLLSVLTKTHIIFVQPLFISCKDLTFISDLCYTLFPAMKM